MWTFSVETLYSCFASHLRSWYVYSSCVSRGEYGLGSCVLYSSIDLSGGACYHGDIEPYMGVWRMHI